MQYSKITPTIIDAIRMDEIMLLLENASLGSPPDFPEWIATAMGQQILVVGAGMSVLYDKPFTIGAIPTRLAPNDWIITDGRSIWSTSDGDFSNAYSPVVLPPPPNP